MGNSIENLLNELPNTTSDDISEWCDKFCEYYSTNVRHSYSEITKYVLSNDGGIEYIDLIIPKLKEIRSNITDEKVAMSITKLVDHIQLEVIRYNFLYQLITNTVAEKYIELNNEQLDGINNLSVTMNEQAEKTKTLLDGYIAQSKQLEEDLVEIHKEVEVAKALSDYTQKISKKAKNKVEDAQKESITILGIFASIVLAFTGGMMFSSSVLENISKSSAYRIIIITLIIGFVLINTIVALALYLNNIVRSGDMVEEQKIWERAKSLVRKNIFWIATDVIIVALIGATYIGWLYSSEKKLLDTGNKYNIEKLNKDTMEIIDSISGNQ